MGKQSQATVTAKRESRESKKRIEEGTMIPTSQQRLTTLGKRLNEEESMLNNNIKKATTIETTLRLHGGMKGETFSSAEAVDDRQVKRRTSETFSEISEINEIKLTDVTEALIKTFQKNTVEHMQKSGTAVK